MKSSLKTAFAALASVIALSATSVAMADEPAAAPSAPTPAPAATTSTPLQTRPVKKLELASQNEGTPVGYKLLAGAVVVAGAVVYAKKKKGGLTKDKTKKASSIDLLARRSVGVRSEVLVVEVEGTRLLVGMTPGSMSTLAVLQTPEGVIGEESPLMGEEKYMDEATKSAYVAPAASGRVSHPELSSDEDDEPAPVRVGRKAAPAAHQAAPHHQEEVDELEGRVRSLLEARKKKAELPAVTTPKPARRPAQGHVATQSAGARSVPGQAKGLLLSMQDADVTKLGDW